MEGYDQVKLRKQLRFLVLKLRIQLFFSRTYWNVRRLLRKVFT
jgi:hypothetical protein